MQVSAIYGTERQVDRMLESVQETQADFSSAQWTPIPIFTGYDITRRGEVRRWWSGCPSTDTIREEPEILKPTGGARKVFAVWEVVHKDTLPERELPRTAPDCTYVGVLRRLALARLLLTAFDRVPRKGEVARHLNDKTHDHRLSNLAWGTRLDNIKDAIANERLRPPRKGR